MYIDPYSFLPVYFYSIPILAIIYVYVPSIYVFPIYILSVISAKYLYSRAFYFPFFINLSIILYTGIVVNQLGIWIPIDLAISTGTIISMITDERLRSFSTQNNSMKGKEKKREISRDYVQTFSGIVVLVLIALVGLSLSRELVTLSVMGLYLIGNYYSRNRRTFIGSLLNSFERDSTPLGIGAIWFAIGVLFAYAIVDSVSVLFIVAFVLMIGDSLATIAGTKIKSFPLFFNKNKSFSGFTALLISSAIFGYFIIGPMAIVYAVIGAMIESGTRKPLDDNYTIPLGLTILSIILQVV